MKPSEPVVIDAPSPTETMADATEQPTVQTAAPDATEQPTVQTAAPVAAACRMCAAGLDGDQRYCLNCGEPVAGLAPPLDAMTTSTTSTVAVAASQVARRSQFRPLAALGGATLAGALLTALLIAALGGNDPQAIEVNVPASKPPVVNVAAAPTSGAPVVEGPFVSDWPGDNAWTVQLQELPKSGTVPSAVVAAKTAATGAGGTDVGALDSDVYPSLDGGNYIVYSGVHKTKAKAAAALKTLKSKFADAKVVRVAAAAAAAPKATKQSTKKLKDLRKSSGDDFVEKSKKLPDSVVTPGPAVPKDAPTSPTGPAGDVETIG